MATETASVSDPARIAPEAERCPLTAIVLTFNEADNIGPCLADLHWVDEVIVVDSFSEDGTIETARQVRPGIRTFSHSFQDFGNQRNWSLDHTSPRNGWILFLDADERCPAAFRQAVQEAVADPGENVGYYLCYRNYFLGQWLKRITLFPSWQLRLLRRGEVRFRKMGHGQQEVTDGPLGYIHEPYDHFGLSKGVAHWIARHNVYSSDEVELVTELAREPLQLGQLLSADSVSRRRCLKRIAARLPLRPWFAFLYSYIVRLGFLDGRAGLYFCWLKLAHDLHVSVKVAEARFSAAKSADGTHSL